MRVQTPEIEGYLESPGAWHRHGETLVIAGWALGRRATICAIDASIDGGPAQTLGFGLVRADVARRYDSPHAHRSGFGGMVDLQGHTPRRLNVELFATLDDGRRVRWCERDVRMYGDGWGARAGRVRTAAVSAIREAIRTRRLPGAPAQWPGVLIGHWRGVPYGRPQRAEAPAIFDRAMFDASCRAFLEARPPSSAPAIAGPISIVAIADRSFPVESVVAVGARAHPRPELWVVAVEPLPQQAVAMLGRASAHVIDVTDLLDVQGCWLPPGTAERVVLLDGSCIPTAHGLSVAVGASLETRSDWVYTDDVRVDHGRPRDGYFKGTFSPELALVDDYATRLAVVTRDAIVRAGGLRSGASGAHIADLLLRVAAAGGSIAHCPEVCCERVAETPAIPGPGHREAAVRAIRADGDGQATIDVRARPGAPLLGMPYVKWSVTAADAGGITIVIPTRDRLPLLRRCVTSLQRTVDSGGVRLLIVDDRSTEPATRDYLDGLLRDRVLACSILRPAVDDRRFNYARLMNAAAASVETPLILHLNNDVEALEPGWLDQMAGWLTRPAVGVVGAKLLHADDSIQHAGVLVSSWHGTPEHLFRRLAGGDPGYQRWPHRPRNVAAVTGACLLTRTALYRELGGFDAERLAVQFNDIDYCLRAIAAGYRIVLEPAAVLRHDESASRGRTFDYRENAYFSDAYRDYRDRYASPHFDHDSLCGPTPVLTSPERTR